MRTERFRRGATWGPNDTIVFATDSSPDLMSVPAAGGTPSVLVPAKLFAGAALRWPSWRRDDSEVVFTIWTTGLEAARVGAYSLRSGQGAAIAEGTNPMRLPTGELLYGRGGSLRTVPVDWKKLTATSAPTAVLDGLQPNIGGAVFVAASDDGSLAYVAGGSGGSNRAITWMTRDGQREPLLDRPLTYLNQRVSPDGRRVAVQIASTDTEDDVWLYDLSTRVLSRLTSGGGRHLNPVWTPDSRRIIYAHGSTSEETRSLYWMAADGTGEEERLTTTPRNQTPFDVSPDGRTLIFSQVKEDGRAALWTMSLVGDRTPRVYLQTAFDDTRARFSPDGRWVAYQSNEAGPAEVYVRPFPGPGGKWQVSTGGGVSPVWSPTGKELYFLRTGQMMAVDVQSGTTFGLGVPRQLFAYTAPRGPFIFSEHSMPPDGRRFLLLMSADPETAPEVLVAVNWIDELKRRAATAR